MWFPIPRRDDGVFGFCMASRDWYLSSRWSASSWLAEPGGWNKCHNLSCFLQNFKDRFYILIPTSFLRAGQSENSGAPENNFFPPCALNSIFSSTMTIVVQGECRAELARAMLSRSPQSPLLHKSNGKGNKISLRSTNVFLEFFHSLRIIFHPLSQRCTVAVLQFSRSYSIP